jgi:hypothetical protein
MEINVASANMVIHVSIVLSGKKSVAVLVSCKVVTIDNKPVRMLGPRLTSRGDIDSRDEERGKSTPCRLPGRNG